MNRVSNFFCKKRIFLPLCFLIIVSIAIAFYFFLRPLDTKNWNTYISSVYKYSIKYPKQWETFGYGIDPQDDWRGNDKYYQEKHFTNPKNRSEEILLKVWSYNALRWNIFEREIRTMPYKNKRMEEPVVDGIQALEVIGDPPPLAGIPIDQKNRCNKWIYSILSWLSRDYLCLNNRQALAIFSKDDYIYILQTSGVNFKNFDAMLNSFKFQK